VRARHTHTQLYLATQERAKPRSVTSRHACVTSRHACVHHDMHACTDLDRLWGGEQRLVQRHRTNVKLREIGGALHSLPPPPSVAPWPTSEHTSDRKLDHRSEHASSVHVMCTHQSTRRKTTQSARQAARQSARQVPRQSARQVPRPSALQVTRQSARQLSRQVRRQKRVTGPRAKAQVTARSIACHCVPHDASDVTTRCVHTSIDGRRVINSNTRWCARVARVVHAVQRHATCQMKGSPLGCRVCVCVCAL
jgi:hypothetical protein